MIRYWRESTERRSPLYTVMVVRNRFRGSESTKILRRGLTHSTGGPKNTGAIHLASEMKGRLGLGQVGSLCLL